MKTKRNTSKLALKLIIGVILLGIIICTVSGYVGFNQYRREIKKTYNNTAYQIAETAYSFTSPSDLEEYVKLVTDYRNGIVSKDEVDSFAKQNKYQAVIKQLTNLREKMGANDIFFTVVDKTELNNYQGNIDTWIPLSYIYDCYAVPEYNFMLGDTGRVNPDFIEDINILLDTGERSDNFFESKSDFGYNTSAIQPIKNSKGEVIAVIGVEVPMVTIEAALRKYITNAVTITIALIAMFLVIYIIYVIKSIINPIDTISSEVGKFIKTRQLSEKLKQIKTKDEIENLSESVLKMENDLNEYIDNLTKVTAEKERIGAELDVARTIQSSMLPCIFPAFPNIKEIDIYASMLAAKEVGGDFYDFFMVDDTHIAVVMADVSGKGVPAALFMVIGKTLIKDHTTPGKDLGEVFTEVNNLLCEANSEGLFITAFEAVIDLVTGDVRYVNAGHEMPIIARKGEPFEALKIKRGFVLAGMEDYQYTEQTGKLNPGDRLFLYTDGVPEATNSNNELFNMDRTVETVNKHRDLKPNELLPKVKEDIDAFVGTAPQFDDITMLCIDYLEAMKK